jgi:predicted Fe-Mo cluster-binding NifX family protein
MRVAVTAQRPELDSPMDARFGRANYFVVVDTETGHYAVHDNALSAEAVQGAGVQAARAVADFHVEAVLSGSVGPKALRTLRAANVRVYSGARVTVRAAIKMLLAGELEPVDEQHVPDQVI